MWCPCCDDEASPLRQIGDVAVLACCGACVVVTADGARLAMGADVDRLAPDELADLRHHRGTKRGARAR